MIYERRPPLNRLLRSAQQNINSFEDIKKRERKLWNK